jgi:hypothetical protein
VPRFAQLISDPEAESSWLLTLTDELRDTVATALPDRLREVSEPWSGITEFPPGMAPEDLFDFLGELAELAIRARSIGHRLYCLVEL